MKLPGSSEAKANLPTKSSSATPREKKKLPKAGSKNFQRRGTSYRSVENESCDACIGLANATASQVSTTNTGLTSERLRRTRVFTMQSVPNVGGKNLLPPDQGAAQVLAEQPPVVRPTANFSAGEYRNRPRS